MTTPAATTGQLILADAREDIARADQKATAILSTIAIGFSLVLAGQLSGDWSPEKLINGGISLWWIGAGFAVAAGAAAAGAIWPRLDSAKSKQEISNWLHIAAIESQTEFKSRLASMSGPDDRLFEQLFYIAKIAKRKYVLVRCAIIASAVALVLIWCAVLIG